METLWNRVEVEMAVPLEVRLEQAGHFVNPFQLPIWLWFTVGIVKFVLEEVLDKIIVTSLRHVGHSKLPSREPKPIIKGLEKFELIDYAFLTINQLVELVFVWHLLNFASKMPMDLENVTFSNTILAFYATFLIDDFFYYWLHRFMHVPAVYPYIHKHHHRQALPTRGYVDAANESPLEQVGGLACVWLTMLIVLPVFGYHAATVIIFFSCYAALAILNHTPYDVKFGLWGLKYTVRAHESHHRLLRGNYAQNTMFWDHLFGTFLPYRTRASEAEKSE